MSRLVTLVYKNYQKGFEEHKYNLSYTLLAFVQILFVIRFLHKYYNQTNPYAILLSEITILLESSYLFPLAKK